MTQDTDSRLQALWDHLGLTTAHVATQMAGDIVSFVQSAPERLASLVLCVPSRLDPAPFADIAARIILIGAERGMTATVTANAHARLPNAKRHVLNDYDAPGWADVIADRTSEIIAILGALPSLQAANLRPGTGSHAGITYSIQGNGPPLVLLPFFLAPSQWQPALP